MEKERNQNTEDSLLKKNDNTETDVKPETENSEEILKKNPEEKITDLEDKVARTLAEMENQRRRFEKEKEEAFEYGGFNFAREALSLIDNLERSKLTLENDESLKNSEVLKKMLAHLK